MKRFVLTGPAERDLDQVKQFLVEQAGPKIARRVLSEIRNGLALLGTEPGFGHLRMDLTDRPLKFWPIYSYLVVYNPDTKPFRLFASCMECATLKTS